MTPTDSPTEHPTFVPTDVPTDEPAHPESHPPTAIPSTTPTEHPTAAPVELPEVGEEEEHVPVEPGAGTCYQVVGETELHTTNCPCEENEFEFRCWGPPPGWIEPGEEYIEIAVTLGKTDARKFGEYCKKIDTLLLEEC